MAADTKEVIHRNQQPLKVILQKTNDGYRWEVSVSGRDVNEILAEVRILNDKLKGEYGGRKK